MDLRPQQDISKNFCWLRPLCVAYPDTAPCMGWLLFFLPRLLVFAQVLHSFDMRVQCRQVPSAFFIGDCLLRLDNELKGAFLMPADGDSKTTMACEEGKRLKKLMGSLRHLYRNSGSIKFNQRFPVGSCVLFSRMSLLNLNNFD